MDERRFAKRLQNMGGNVIREILKVTQQPNIISFAGGNPAVDTFPAAELAEIAQDILLSNPNILQYGMTEGYAPLREYLADWVGQFGIKASPANVLIMSGSQQGLDLLGKAFLDPGDKVVMESPTYLAAIQIFKTYQASFAVVHGDQDGACVDSLEEVIAQEKPKIAYLVPTFQNPTGVTMSLERRRQVGEMLSRHEVIVIEDDPYALLRYAGNTLPAIKSFDHSGQVVYCGSFSKLISPGLRVGFAVAEPEVLQKMVIGKQGTDVHTNNLGQAMVYEFCRRGMLEPHIEKTREKYSRKLNIMKEHLKLFPDNIDWIIPQGGLFFWGTLPDSVNATKLLEVAVKEKVAFVPGESFFVEGGNKNTIRLNFSNASEEMIRDGMQRLAKVYNEFVQ